MEVSGKQVQNRSMLATSVAVGVSYFLLCNIGLSLAVTHPSATTVWPGSGLALAAFLLCGGRVWPAIFVAAFVVNVTTAGNSLTSVAISIGNTLEALVGSTLVNRFAEGKRAFDGVQSAVRYIMVAPVGPSVSATFGVLSLVLGGFISWDRYGLVWLTWWVGNIVSILVIAPVCVAWARSGWLRIRFESFPEVFFLIGALLLVNSYDFSRWFELDSVSYPVELLNIPLLMWAALRFRPQGALAALLLMSLIAIWGASAGFGPFAKFGADRTLLLLQGIVALVAAGTLVFVSGIAERRRGEEELQFQRTLLQAQSEASLDGFLVVANDKRIVSYNRRFAEMWLLEEDILFTRSDEQALKAVESLLVNPQEFYDRVQYLYENPEAVSHEEILLRDGRIFERYSAPVRDEKGTYYGRIWQFRDISARKRAEQELRESEARYRTLAETSPVGIWQTTTEGHTLYINPAMCALLEVSGPEEMVGKTYYDFYTPESIERVKQEHAKRLRGVSSSYEVVVVGKRGAVRHLIINGAPIVGPDGKVQSLIATVVDVSEQRRAHEEIQMLNQSLEQRVQERTAALQDSNEQMEAFCYSISHDLRAPLRAMQGFTTALKEDLGSAMSDVGREYADRIVEAAQRMDRLIQDLLEYSRLGRMELNLKEVRLEKVIEDAMFELRSEIAGSEASVSIQQPLPAVLGHEAVLEQVFINLLSNSLKFVLKNTRPEVSVIAEDHGATVRIVVKDNGIGIDPAHQERIFRVFERLHTVESYPGTGIGLAIVRKAVERMGGTTGVDSKPGQGSSFWIELPKPRR